MASPKIANYLRNVGKSVTYVAVDYLKDTGSATAEFLDTNKDLFKEVYASARDLKGTIKKVEKSWKDSKIYEAVDVAKKNVIEDLKTGNFYNREREEQSGFDALGIDFSGFNEDFSNDFTDTSAETRSPKRAIEDAIGTAAQAQSRSFASNIEYLVQTTKASSRMSTMQTERILGVVSSGFTALGSKVTSIADIIQGPLQTHLQNSTAYYENTTKLLQEQTAMMREIVDLQRKLYSAPQQTSRRESSYDKIVGSRGTPDIKAYLKHLVKKGKNDSGLDMFDMFFDGSLGEGNFLLNLVSSPLKFIPNAIVKMAVPSIMKKTIESIDEGIGTLFSNLNAKFNKNRRNDPYGSSMLSMVMNFLGVETDDRPKKFHTDKYNKGPVPFDGIVRQNIIEVIPGYLRRIEAALTGTYERIYDNERGKWINVKDLKNQYNRERGNYANNAGSDLIYLFSEQINALNKVNEKEAKKFKETLSKMLDKAYQKDYGVLDLFDKEAKGDRAAYKASKHYGLTEEEAIIFYKYIVPKLTGTEKGRSVMRNLPSKVANSYKAERDQWDKWEQGYGPFRELFNGAYDFDEFPFDGVEYDDMPTHFKRMIERMGYVKKKDNKGNKKRSGQTSSITSTIEESREDAITGILDSLAEQEKEKTKNDEKRSKSWFGTLLQDKFDLDINKSIKDQIKEKNGEVGLFGYTAGVLAKIEETLRKPSNLITGVLDKADKKLFSFVFGEEPKKKIFDKDGNEVKVSLLEYLIHKVDDTFTKVFDKINDMVDNFRKKIVESELYKKFMDKTAGIRQNFREKFWDPFKNQLKSKFGGAFATVKDAYKGSINDIRQKMAYSALYNSFDGAIPEDFQRLYDQSPGGFVNQFGVSGGKDKYLNWRTNWMNNRDQVLEEQEEMLGYIPTNAYGGYVTKGGLTFISPGEIIIPSSTDPKVIARQKKQELAMRRKYFGKKSRIPTNAQGNYWDQFMGGMENALGPEKMKTYKGYFNKAKEIAPDVASSGVLGGAIGAIFGGPLLGAVIGAGSSIIKNSETAQNFLFGKINDKGERENGIIPKSLIDTVNKYLPDFKKYGIVGAVTGLFTPLGPVGGLMVGGALSFIKNNEKFNEYLFGSKDEDNGLFSKEFQAKVKKAFPKMVVGAAAGALMGPFGLLGNAAMGAGLGLFSTTDTFNNILFGKPDENGDRDGGMLGAFKTGVIDPIAETLKTTASGFKEFFHKNIIEKLKNFVDPFAQMIKNGIGEFFDFFKRGSINIFERFVGRPMKSLFMKLFAPVGNFMNGILKGAIKLGKGAISLPFSVLGGIGTHIKHGQIAKGTAGRSTAAERNKIREDTMSTEGNRFYQFLGIDENPFTRLGKGGTDKFRNADAFLESATDDQILEIQSLLASRKENKGKAQKRYMDSLSSSQRKSLDVYNSLDTNGNFARRFSKDGSLNGRKDAEKWLDKLYKAAAKGDHEAFEKVLNDPKANLSEEEKQRFRSNYDFDQLDRDYNRAEYAKFTNADIDAKLKELTGGSFSLKDKNISRLEKYIGYEADARNKNKKEEESPIETLNNGIEDSMKTHTDRLIESISISNELLKMIASGEKIALGKDEEGNDEDLDSVIKGRIDKKTAKKTLKKRKSKRIQFGSKESTEERKAEEREEKIQEKMVETMDNTNKLSKIFTGDEEAKGGIAEFIKTLGGGFMKFLGFGGKALKIAGIGTLAFMGMGLGGHLQKWFDESAWPKMKNFIFGKEDTDTGKREGGLVGALGKFADKLGLSDHLKKIGDGITSIVNKGKEIIQNPRTVLEPMFNFFLEGVEYSIEHAVAPLTATLIRSLPSVAWGLLKGLWQAIIGKKEPDGKTSMTPEDYAKAIEEKADTGNRYGTTAGSLLTSSDYSAYTTTTTGQQLSTETKNGTNAWVRSKSGFMFDSNSLNRIQDGYERNELGQLIVGADAQNYLTVDPQTGEILNDYGTLNNKRGFLGTMVDAAPNALFRGMQTGKSSKLLKLAGNISNPKIRNILRLKNALPNAFNIAKGGVKLGGKFLGGIQTVGANIINGRNAFDGLFGRVAQEAAEGKIIDFEDIVNGTGTGINHGSTHTLASQFNNFKAQNVASEVTEAATDVSKGAGKGILDKLKGIFGVNKANGGGKKGLLASGKDAIKEKVAGFINSILNKAKESGLYKKICELCTKGGIEVAEDGIFKGIKNGLVSKIDDIVTKFGQKLVAKIGTAAIKIFTIAAELIISFTSGWTQAETFLGIAKQDTEFECTPTIRLVSGLTKMLNELLLGIIPIDWLMQKIIQPHILPIFGVDVEEIEKAQARSTQLLDKLNADILDGKYKDYSFVPQEGITNIEDNNRIVKQIQKYESAKTGLGKFLVKTGAHVENFFAKHEILNPLSWFGWGRNKGNGRSTQDQYANMPYGNSTIGEAGCGPVAASNLLRGFGSGVPEMANYAMSNGFTAPDGGTDISYFNSVLNSRGIPNVQTTNRQAVYKALKNGGQAVLLGDQPDAGLNSAYGKTPHFITAKGIRGNNVIIDDPDLNQTRMRPVGEVLGNMDRSVIAYGRGMTGRRHRYGKARNDVYAVSADFGGYNGNNLGPQAIINVARSQIGVIEKPKNQVKYNHAYYNNNVNGDKFPWCVAFVWWVFNQAGASKLFYGGGKTASCATLKDYHYGKGQKTETLRAGDIVFFNFDGGSTPKHVGIVTGVNDDGSINSVEGNTSPKGSQSNGGMVLEKRRNKKYIVGAYRPNYPYNYNQSSVINMHKYGDDNDYMRIAANGGSMNATDYTTTDYSDSGSSSGSTGNLLTALKDLGVSMLKAIFGADAYNALFGDGDTSTITEDDGGANTPGDGVLTAHENDIYNHLRSSGHTAAGAAATMANLYWESGLRPNNLQDTFNTSLNMTDEQYTSAIANNSYTRDRFINDNAGYGLAQWTYRDRKAALYDALKNNSKPISDLKGQLDFLNHELLTSYPDLYDYLKTTDDHKTATDRFLEEFENPKVKNYDERRRTAAEYYEKFKDRPYYTINDSVDPGGHSTLTPTYDYGGATELTAAVPTAGGLSGGYYSGTGGGGGGMALATEFDFTGRNGVYLGLPGYGRNKFMNKSHKVSGSAAATLNRGYARNNDSQIRQVQMLENALQNGTTRNSSMEYARFLTTIVDILLSISSNTEALNQILNLLSERMGINIKASEVNESITKAKSKAREALTNLIAKSTNNRSALPQMIQLNDTEFIINSMTAQARE